MYAALLLIIEFQGLKGPYNSYGLTTPSQSWNLHQLDTQGLNTLSDGELTEGRSSSELPSKFIMEFLFF